MKRCLTAVTLGVLSLGTTSVVAAQTATGNPATVSVTASATVNDMLQLTLSSITTDLGTPTVADFNAGYLNAVGPTATVKSNRAWTVNVKGHTATFTGSGTANPTKSAADLQWGTTAGTYNHDMSTVAPLATGAATANSGALPIFFHTLWNYATDSPGTYSLVVDFTLSAP